MKIKEILNHYQELTKLTGKKYPAKLSYAISRNIRILEKEFDVYEEQRTKICKDLCERDDSGAPVMIVNENGVRGYKIPEKNNAVLKREIEDLLDTEVDVNIYYVPECLIGKCDESERYDVPEVEAMLYMGFMIHSEED